jgi:hypothetical protein
VATQALDQPVSPWNARRGIIAACSILAIVLAFWALWSWATEPSVPPFPIEARRQLVDEGLKKMTPVQAWIEWIQRYRPMAEHGIQEMQHLNASAIEQQAAEQRFLAKMLLSVAGTFVLLAVIATVWPRAAAVPRRG